MSTSLSSPPPTLCFVAGPWNFLLQSPVNPPCAIDAYSYPIVKSRAEKGSRQADRTSILRVGGHIVRGFTLYAILLQNLLRDLCPRRRYATSQFAFRSCHHMARTRQKYYELERLVSTVNLPCIVIISQRLLRISHSNCSIDSLCVGVCRHSLQLGPADSAPIAGPSYGPS